jgi:basic amino acid/polyamine antiporter, APA family
MPDNTPESSSNVAVATDSHTGHFKRAMGLVDATAIVVGSMIGSGIFIVSAETARNVGSPGLMLMCWIVAGILTILSAICYSELASMFPKAGGQYVFLREAFGPLVGFLYGWTLFAVIQSGTIAAVGVAFAKFLGVFVPSVSPDSILLELGAWKMSVLQVISVVLIAFLTWLNTRGIETAKNIQTSFTATKVFALAALIILGLLSFEKYYGAPVNFGANFWAAPDAPQTLGMVFLAMSLAMVGPLFSMDAWNNITFAGEEVKDAEKILPRSLVLGTLTVIGLYTLANIVYLLLIPLHGTADATTVVGRGIQYATSDRVGTAAAEIIFGDIGKYLMAGAIMISTFGCLNGLILAGARVYYAMAKDNLFFQRAAVLDPKTNVPVFGLIVQGIWSAILATSGTYSDLLEYVVFAALAFYVATVAAVIVLRKTRPDAERPYKTPLYPLLPIVYLITAIAIMGGQVFTKFGNSGKGLLIILSGLPIYFIWVKLRRSQAATSA